MYSPDICVLHTSIRLEDDEGLKDDSGHLVAGGVPRDLEPRAKFKPNVDHRAKPKC